PLAWRAPAGLDLAGGVLRWHHAGKRADLRADHAGDERAPVDVRMRRGRRPRLALLALLEPGRRCVEVRCALDDLVAGLADQPLLDREHRAPARLARRTLHRT